MRLKSRLILSNSTTVVIPILTTVVVVLLYVLISQNFQKENGFLNSIEDLISLKSQLFELKNNTIPQNPDKFLDEQYQKNIVNKLRDIYVDLVVVKNKEVKFKTLEFSIIDYEKMLNPISKGIDNNLVEISNVKYSIDSISVVFKDGSNGNILLLLNNSGKVSKVDFMLILAIVTFVLSFIITNLFIAYNLSNHILRPLDKLKTSAKYISEGNLSNEVVEDGDFEIMELCRDFEEMRIRLKDSIYVQKKYEENRKFLVSSISHDLRTPITSIKGYVEGIFDGVANTKEKQEKYLKTIYQKAIHVDKLIDDLLLLSKLDLKEFPFNMEVVHIQKFIEDCMADTEIELEKANIKIVYKDEIDTNVYILIDRDKMKRVFINIIDNAKKYMNKEDGQIIVVTRLLHDNVLIEINDNGVGILKDDLPNLFEKFYRGDTSRGENGGSGLGLSICKYIIEGHEGKIWARSEKGNGTSFIISLKREKGEV